MFVRFDLHITVDPARASIITVTVVENVHYKIALPIAQERVDKKHLRVWGF